MFNFKEENQVIIEQGKTFVHISKYFLDAPSMS